MHEESGDYELIKDHVLHVISTTSIYEQIVVIGVKSVNTDSIAEIRFNLGRLSRLGI